jgi:hypothetical protein
MNLRPVLLLTAPIGSTTEILVAYISSVLPPALLPSDIVLDPQTPEGQATNVKTITEMLQLLKPDMVEDCLSWHVQVRALPQAQH